MPDVPRFHLAIAVDDLSAAEEFYGEVLGCSRGRSADAWIDWDLRGHQLVTHLVQPNDHTPPGDAGQNPVDGDAVPVPHFGLVLTPGDWRELADRLRAAETDFLIGPRTRFEGEPGEQSTMFVRDPAGNALEFKAFADDAQVFPRLGSC